MAAAVPSNPDVFFTEYLPERFARAAPDLGAASSVGSVTARVLGVGEWSLRISEGALAVVRGMEDDVVLQLTATQADFDALVREPFEHFEALGHVPIMRVGPLRALAASAETARQVRHVPGSLLFVARDGAVRHRLLLTPGRRNGDMNSPECTIDCALSDLRDAQAGAVAPMQLFTSGRLKIGGNVQIAMALAAVLV